MPAGEVKIWPAHSLRAAAPPEEIKVSPPSPSPSELVPPTSSKLDIKVVRAKRLEARNISEEEQAAALAAPAAKKRVSKPTPKAAALVASVAVARPKRETKPPKKLADRFRIQRAGRSPRCRLGEWGLLSPLARAEVLTRNDEYIPGMPRDSFQGPFGLVLFPVLPRASRVLGKIPCGNTPSRRCFVYG